METSPASSADDAEERLSEFLGPEAEQMAREALDYALENAEYDGDGFTPFAFVARVNGDRSLYRFMVGGEQGNDLAEGVRAGRDTLAEQTDASALSVALAWDGFLTGEDRRQEAVFVEAYELGRQAGAVLAVPYERVEGRPAPLEAPVLCDEPSPLVPPTVETARRHLADWGADASYSLRWLVEQLGADLQAYDYDPYTCLPQLDEFVARFTPGDLAEHRAFLHSRLAAYVAEVLIRGRGAYWEVIPDARNRNGYAYVVMVPGTDGTTHHVDPYRVVGEHLDPVPQRLALILERVEFSIP